jgi:hypothetical protein
MTHNTPTDALPPGLFGRTELSLLASRAAIALDAGVRERPIDLDPIQELGSVLASGLGEAALGPQPVPSKLVDPATSELLARLRVSVGNPASADPLECALKAAAEFVQASRGDVASLMALGTSKLAQLRDFSLDVSIAVRSTRALSLPEFLRSTR